MLYFAKDSQDSPQPSHRKTLVLAFVKLCAYILLLVCTSLIPTGSNHHVPIMCWRATFKVSTRSLTTLRRTALGHEERTSVRLVTPCVQGLGLGHKIEKHMLNLKIILFTRFFFFKELGDVKMLLS